MTLVDTVSDFINSRVFPSDEVFFSMFAPNGDRFIDQEDLNWDFKDQWPFSYSDEYFLGIVRLICSFANTSGGFVVFGVHDQKRTGGHNKVQPNTDKLRQSLLS